MIELHATLYDNQNQHEVHKIFKAVDRYTAERRMYDFLDTHPALELFSFWYRSINR